MTNQSPWMPKNWKEPAGMKLAKIITEIGDMMIASLKSKSKPDLIEITFFMSAKSKEYVDYIESIFKPHFDYNDRTMTEILQDKNVKRIFETGYARGRTEMVNEKAQIQVDAIESILMSSIMLNMPEIREKIASAAKEKLGITIIHI